MKDILKIRQFDLEKMSNNDLQKLQRSLIDYIGTNNEKTARSLNHCILDEWNKRNGFHDYS